MRTRPRQPHRGILAVLFAGMLALAGCSVPGTGDDPQPPPETTATGTSESTEQEPTTQPEPATVLDQHGVNAGHPLAAEAGMEMLNAGGTAVDAAIATAFAVSVVEPYASGVGGGGSALVASPDSSPEAFDYREVVAADGVIPPSNTGIPGFVAGMAELHVQHGTLDWAQLLEPAVRMAEQGVPATEQLINRIAAGGGAATAGQPQFWPGGAALQIGDTLVQTELAETFQTLQNEGPESFYTGTISGQLTQINGLDPVSLERYTVQHSEPPQGPVGDFEVVSGAPALPGAALIQMLQILEAEGVAQLDPESPEYVQQVSEAWLTAEETVQTDLGDPAFVDVPVAELVDPARNAEIADDSQDQALAAGVGAAEPGGNLRTPGNTTHLTVVDSDGTVVSMTNTLTEFWGSGTEVGGFFLNDQLSRFNTVDSPQNQPEPGRRSVTWSNPTMVLDGEGRPVLGIGTPGGANILNILANAIVRWGLMDQSLEQAVAAPRFRFDAASQTLVAEQAFMSTPAAQGLGTQGWQLRASAPGLFGSLQTLEIDYDARTVSGPTDTRLEAGAVVADVS